MSSSEGLLHGLACAPGVGRGRLRIVRLPQAAAELQPGEVLLVPTAAPLWVRCFHNASAIVSPMGGQLCKCATYARIYGLPAVFGVGEAIWTLHNGQLVEVDGTMGTIRLLGDFDSEVTRALRPNVY